MNRKVENFVALVAVDRNEKFESLSDPIRIEYPCLRRSIWRLVLDSGLVRAAFHQSRFDFTLSDPIENSFAIREVRRIAIGPLKYVAVEYLNVLGAFPSIISTFLALGLRSFDACFRCIFLYLCLWFAVACV